MANQRFCLLATAFTLLRCVALAVAEDAECVALDSGRSRALSLSVHGKKNSTGDWVTFSAFVDSSNSTSDTNVEVKHRIIECGGRPVIHIQGVIKGNNVGGHTEGLLFHPKSGSNAAVINNGHTAKKINMEDGLNGVVFTSRPLNNDELFEVKLEKKGSKYDYSSGIGLTTHSPIDHEILAHMNRMKTGTWLFYGADVWNNGTKIIGNYGKNIYELKVGERVGVMRSNTGTLHFFVNGIDQGPAASNLPETLYGVFELFGNVGQVTIVDPPQS